MTTRRERIEIAALVSEIVGAAAVVISVAYLAMQISESNDELVSQSHFNALMLGHRPIELTLGNADLATLVHRGTREPDALSPDEWFRFTQYQVMAVNAWEFFYYEHAKGSMSEQLWTGADNYYTVLLKSSPGMQRFWSENRHVYAAPFNDYVDAIIESANRGAERSGTE